MVTFRSGNSSFAFLYVFVLWYEQQINSWQPSQNKKTLSTSVIMTMEYEPGTLQSIRVRLTLDDLPGENRASGLSPEVLESAQPILEKARKIWNPMAVFRWLRVHQVVNETDGANGTVVLLNPESDERWTLEPGFSVKFLKPADQALVTVYTAGPEIEQEAQKASSREDFLESYLYNLIAMRIMSKTGDKIKQRVEKKAREKKWGVSPFLSPGSVHGWELHDQQNLCATLPLTAINVRLQENSVFSPFHTVSGLIGIGPDYRETRVGTTCHLCSRRKDCPMKRDKTSHKENDHG